MVTRYCRPSSPSGGDSESAVVLAADACRCAVSEDEIDQVLAGFTELHRGAAQGQSPFGVEHVRGKQCCEECCERGIHRLLSPRLASCSRQACMTSSLRFSPSVSMFEPSQSFAPSVTMRRAEAWCQR